MATGKPGTNYLADVQCFDSETPWTWRATNPKVTRCSKLVVVAVVLLVAGTRSYICNWMGLAIGWGIGAVTALVMGAVAGQVVLVVGRVVGAAGWSSGWMGGWSSGWAGDWSC
jgi:hypothetical protein